MTTQDRIMESLATVPVPGGGNLVSADLVRALQISGDGVVRFVIEATDPQLARALEPARAQAEALLKVLPGVTSV